MQHKIDDRIISLVKYSNFIKHRCFFVLVGTNTTIHLPKIYNILSANSTNSVDSIIWCHKNERVIKDLKKLEADNENKDKLSEFFKLANIQFMSYNESDKILGQTVDLLILQDFESLTPNLIALSIETVRGGGIVVLLLDNSDSIESMTNVKNEFLLDEDFVPRYNKRLFRSLFNTQFSIFIDNSFQVLPITKFNLKSVDYKECKFEEQHESNCNIDNVLINLGKTKDQRVVINELITAICNRSERLIYSILAGRGRGKSVALGIVVSKAIDLKYSSIYISAPALENVKQVFEYITNGLIALGYKKYVDFKLIYSFKSRKRLVQRIEITKGIKQTVEYFSPFDDLKYHPDMLIVDEAAAIPLPLLKKLLFPNIIIMATTNSGYEGTGRAFSTKMTEYLRVQSNADNPFTYNELSMNTSIRYRSDDMVEKWLNSTLLLSSKPQKIEKCPIPSSCNLYYINKDVLFNGNASSEKILKDVFGLFIASHYKNSPNDIQILADSPTHEIFTLLLTNEDKDALPRVLCAIHVSFEGRCKKELSKKGNLIPWIVSETHFDNDFINLLGMRIVRIAVHPDYMSMGYGTRALQLLMDWIKANQHSFITRLKLSVEGKDTDTLFFESDDILIPKIIWLGTSFGVTEKILNFWKKHDLVPICIKQKISYITGENTLIVMKALCSSFEQKLVKYYKNFKIRFIGQLAYNFRNLSSSICLILVFNKISDKFEEQIFLSNEDINRIAKFAKGTVNILQIIDLMPLIARIFFTDRLKVELSPLQQSILLMLGCQHKLIEDISKEHNLKIYEVNTILIKIANIIIFELKNIK